MERVGMVGVEREFGWGYGDGGGRLKRDRWCGSCCIEMRG